MPRPQTRPSLKYYNELKNNPYQKPNPTQPHQTDIEAIELADNTDTSTSISTHTDTGDKTEVQILSPQPAPVLESTIIEASSTIQPQKLPRTAKKQTRKLSPTSGNKSQKGLNSPTSTSTSGNKSQKVSKDQPFTPTEREIEKLSRATPVIYGEKRLQNKTALTLVHLYSQEMTPEQIDLMFDYREELQLTHSELVALSLLRDMGSKNPHIKAEATKRYWKIQETIEKSKKPATSVSPNNSSLLDRTLENAQEAIFGEIIEKSVDTEN